VRGSAIYARIEATLLPTNKVAKEHDGCTKRKKIENIEIKS